MPRLMEASATFDALEDEILFTRAALQADERAASLLESTTSWLSLLDDARAQDRTLREKVANATAARVVSNASLDAATTAFGDSLLLAVGKDRSTSRWTGFFKEPVSRFIQQGLSSQVSTVLSWLRSASDPVLETHRAELTKWATAAEAALEQTQDLTTLRTQNWQRREALALTLTQERDRLHAALQELARKNALARDWPDLFFLVPRASST